jgi:spore coat polysaccharide biosynthesis predicted glycosyltransferase SpsG
LRGSREEGGPLLITLGGSDPAHLTRAMVALAVRHQRQPFTSVQAILGPAAQDAHWVDSSNDFTVLHDPPRVEEVFGGAVAAISAGGSTACELLCLGVPTAVVEVSPEQTAAARQAAAAGAALALGPAEDALGTIPAAIRALADADVRRRLSCAAMRYIDPRGADRVIEALERRLRAGDHRGAQSTDR